MDLGIDGRVALVAAASQGLGKASAAALAREGARVAILSRREEVLRAAAEEIGAALAVPCDLSNKDSIDSAAATVIHRLGPVEILVNNCGGPPAGGFDSLSEQQWYESFEQVFLSALRMTRAVLPGMRQRKWGRIINIVSSSVSQPIPGLMLSNAFRPALAGWAKTLASEVAPDNILVTSVAPGRILTARMESIDKSTAERTGRSVEEVQRAGVQAVPLKRYGHVEEFGAVVAFLASARASYLTGSVVRVDGGAISAL